jgi:TolA-binding protein
MRFKVLSTAIAVLATGSPVVAQTDINGRVVRLESEMRAVQRKVFPGGAGQLLQPDVVAPAASTAASGAPAASAVVDLTARVTSLEQQMATMTGQIEQTSYQLRTLREQFETYKRGTDARLAAATAPAARPVEASAGEDAPRTDRRAATTPRTTLEPPVRSTATGPRPTTAAAAATSSTIERPTTGDPAEDSYLYGYRLWESKRYAEAQAALKRTVADYPKSRRASYAQNLLGRAYLDDGKPSLASMAFYDNYKKMPDGERAPDSLLYLGQALVKLNKPADACKVYEELNDVYGAKMSAAMKADVARGRTAAKCT